MEDYNTLFYNYYPVSMTTYLNVKIRPEFVSYKVRLWGAKSEPDVSYKAFPPCIIHPCSLPGGGGCSVLWGIMSTVGNVLYLRGIMINVGRYHKYRYLGSTLTVLNTPPPPWSSHVYHDISHIYHDIPHSTEYTLYRVVSCLWLPAVCLETKLDTSVLFFQSTWKHE